MPIYEYECGACRHRFEKRQRFYDEAVAECPKCQSKSKRLLCSPPIIFKGSGFYVTDYRKGGSMDKSDSPAPPPPPAAKSEAKPKDK